MAAEAGGLDASTKAALQQLADISLPARISFVPQTWGWAALLFVLLILAAAAIVVWRRRREASRYRREALAELDLIEAALADDAGRRQAVLALPPLVKRVALAAWPRETVAPLAGAGWVAFMRDHTASHAFPDVAARLFDDGEYDAGAKIGRDEARLIADAVRQWIETHRVSA